MSNSLNSFGSRLKGKIAIVTASTEGIGFAIAERLAMEGAKVVISSRKEANVKRVVNELCKKGLTVHGVKCHVGNAEDRKNLFLETVRTYGGLDILVSNAAVNPIMGQVIDCGEDAWDKIFEINVKASFLLAKEAVPYLRTQGGGNITFVSSIAGYRPSELLGVYSISKTALLGLSSVLAKELACDKIRVNCVAPGLIRTKFANAIVSSDIARETYLQTVPLNRIGEPSEIGGVVAFLASDDASYITGETIVAAGGLQSRL